MKGVLVLAKIALLLCNASFEKKHLKKLTDTLQEQTLVKEHQKNQMKNLESEMTDLKKAVFEIKSFLTS